LVITGATLTVTNSIVWNNVTESINPSATVSYSCVQGGHEGIGNIASDPLFMTGPGGAYYLSQIAAGQTVNSPCLDGGNPASPMITGTTRTDQVQDAGIVDMGYHYPAVSPIPALDVTLIPVNPPIVIPANGGQFQFNAAVQRTQGPQSPFYVWARDRRPDTSYTPTLLGPVQINPPVGVVVARLRTQVVPAAWLPGLHYYVGYVHTAPEVYPATDADSFSWTKSTTGDGGATITTCENFGESFAPYAVVTGRDACPTSFALDQNRPNPFNPVTAISYKLQTSSHVSLKVYNITGGLVGTLVDRVEEAGSHQVTFDGSELAAGVYLVRLYAGGEVQIQKIVLVK
jgi:hypothetical protein